MTKGPCRIPLKPRSEARMQVSVHCYGVSAHTCGHQPTCDLPGCLPGLYTSSSTGDAEAVLKRLLNQPHNCISYIPVTNPLVPFLWYGHCFDHDDTDKVISSHLTGISSTSMEKSQRAPKKL